MRSLLSGTDQSSSGHRRHLSQDDLAGRWGVSARTLERWRSQQRGPAFLKLVGKVAYRMEDILAYEAAQLRRPIG
jgi:transposase-like protein